MRFVFCVWFLLPIFWIFRFSCHCYARWPSNYDICVIVLSYFCWCSKGVHINQLYLTVVSNDDLGLQNEQSEQVVHCCLKLTTFCSIWKPKSSLKTAVTYILLYFLTWYFCSKHRNLSWIMRWNFSDQTLGSSLC